IVVNTFNHEKYIRRAIEGIINQKVDFQYEILLHDDASTDNTCAILNEYIGRFPELFAEPIFQTENQYSKGVKIAVGIQYPRARGEYIALCEGDDCWTDLNKLQKQVDFLQRNPTFSLTCGGFIKKNSETGSECVEIVNDSTFFSKKLECGFEFSV